MRTNIAKVGFVCDYGKGGTCRVRPPLTKKVGVGLARHYQLEGNSEHPFDSPKRWNCDCSMSACSTETSRHQSYGETSFGV